MKKKEDKAQKTPAELRAEIAAKRQVAKKEVKNPRFEFKKFFTKLKRQKNIDPSLEEVIWVHLQSSGFDTPDKFELGVKHFGI